MKQPHRIKPTETTADPLAETLPDAGTVVDIPRPVSTYSQYDPQIRYNGEGEEREINNPSPKDVLSDRKDQKSLERSFTKTATTAEAPLWGDRTTGREVSPVDFIKMHYGRTNPDGTWDSLGLTRSELRQQDRKLYQAYAAWISPKRHPEDDLKLPKDTPERFSSPEEALEHKLKISREASARYREKQRERLSKII